MATRVINRRGKEVTLLNPAEKGEKFAGELSRGIKQTNAGDLKRNADGSFCSTYACGARLSVGLSRRS